MFAGKVDDKIRAESVKTTHGFHFMTIRTKTNSLQEVSTFGIMCSNDRHEIEKCFSTDTVDRRRPDTGGTHNRRGGGSNTRYYHTK